jgi:hypothetical protein
VQRRRYDLEINAPGAETFATTLNVGSGLTDLDVKLKPGADLRFSIVRPDGERRARFSLFRDGKEVDPAKFDSDAWKYRGLPIGDYVLRIPSAADIAAREGQDYAPILNPYLGRDIPVHIGSDSPDLIDLGEIQLEAVGR